MKSITFDESAREFVLSAFNKGVDDELYIVDGSSEKERVPSTDGTNISISEFAGVAKGSELYIKSDIVSLIEFCDRLRAKES